MHNQRYGLRFLYDNQQMTPTTLIWYDCPICIEMMVLTTLLKLSIHHDDDYQCKKGINAQSML